MKQTRIKAMNASIPIVVGLTGGIGSGKTTVLKAFEDLGVPTYIADVRAKELMTTDINLINSIQEKFGKASYVDGILNTVYLSNIVFKDNASLQLLNALVHPAVRKDFSSWLQAQAAAFVVYESALIFEHHQEHNFDYVILVTAPLEERIERVLKRDQTTREHILDRVNKQLPDDEKAKKSDFIVYNSGKDDYIYQIRSIYDKLLNKN